MRNVTVKRVRAPNAGVGGRSPDIEARMLSGLIRLAENPSTGTRYPLAAIHPDYPIVVEAAQVIASSITNLTSIGIGAYELGFFDYVFHRDNSGAATQPQTKWLDHTTEAKTLAGTNFAYLQELTDAFYVGMADKQYNGLRFDIASAGTSIGTPAIDAEYWNGTAWTDLTESDGTASALHMDQDGTITFTLPADWVAASLRDTFGSTDAQYGELAPSSGQGIGGCATDFNKRAFWIRIKVTSAAYTAAATIKSIKRQSDIVDRVVAATACSGMVAGEPFELTIATVHKGSTGYDNADGVAVGAGIGSYIYAYLIGNGTVTGNVAFGLVIREDLMAFGVDRAFGAKPTSQPLKTMNWV